MNKKTLISKRRARCGLVGDFVIPIATCIIFAFTGNYLSKKYVCDGLD